MSIDLDRIDVASPCSADWDEMVGDERVRFCGQCDLHVYNLSGMDRAEATRFVEEAAGNGERACVRFYKRRDGTLLTQNCPVGFARLRRRVAMLRATAVACLSFVFGGLFSGCTDPDPGPVMGDMVCPVEPASAPEPMPAPEPAEEPLRPAQGELVAEPPSPHVRMGRIALPVVEPEPAPEPKPDGDL